MDSENDLKKYYKHIEKCRHCGTYYGSEVKRDNYRCPNCRRQKIRENRIVITLKRHNKFIRGQNE